METDKPEIDEMKTEPAETDRTVIIANCGLVCSKCGMYTKGKCLGCFGGKPMNRNCKVKKCNASHGYATCAECEEFDELRRCKKVNGLVFKFFGFIFRTDKIGNLNRIREIGLEEFKKENM